MNADHDIAASGTRERRKFDKFEAFYFTELFDLNSFHVQARISADRSVRTPLFSQKRYDVVRFERIAGGSLEVGDRFVQFGLGTELCAACLC